MRRTVIFLIALFVIGIITYGIYYFISNFSYTRHIDLPSQLLASSSTNGGELDIASSTDVFGQTDPSLLIPSNSTVDTSRWLTYTDKVGGFSIKYPNNFTTNTDTPGSIVFFIPKDKYFTWPLLDDVKISVTATSTCPMVIAGAIGSLPATTTANGYDFVRIQGSDVGAGNLYREMAFDTNNQNTCYHLDIFDHGTNGAGFYVSDQSLISQYDNNHDVALDKIVSIFMGMINSFRITNTVI